MAFVTNIKTHRLFALRLQDMHLFQIFIAAVSASHACIRPDRMAAVADEEAGASFLLFAQDGKDRLTSADWTVIALPANFFPDRSIIGLCRD